MPSPLDSLREVLSTPLRITGVVMGVQPSVVLVSTSKGTVSVSAGGLSVQQGATVIIEGGSIVGIIAAGTAGIVYEV